MRLLDLIELLIVVLILAVGAKAFAQDAAGTDTAVAEALKEAEDNAYKKTREKEVSLTCSIIEVSVKKCPWYNMLCNDDIKLKSWIDGNHYNSRNALASETKSAKITTAYMCSAVNNSDPTVTFIDVLEVDPFGAASTWFRLMVDKFGRASMRDGGEIPKRINIVVRKYKSEDIINPTIKKVKSK